MLVIMDLLFLGFILEARIGGKKASSQGSRILCMLFLEFRVCSKSTFSTLINLI
jgi:hypothetical protein